MDRNDQVLAREPPAERRTLHPVPLVWELLQCLHYSLAREQSVHGPTVTRALDKLENLPFLIIWQGWRVSGGGVGASLHLCMVSPSTCTLCN